MIKNKSITDEEFENEKRIVIQELKMGLDEYYERNFENLYKQIYALDPIIGYKNILENLTLKDVYAFMKRYYIAENITISLLTEQKHSDIKSLLTKYFGDIPTGLKNIYKPLVVKHKQIVKKEKDIEQVYLMHLYSLTDFRNIKEYTKALMLCNILSGGLSSILHREIREKYGLAYQIDAALELFDNIELSKNVGVCLYIVSSMDNKNLKKYLKVLPELIKNLPNIITEEDLERVKNKRASREYVSVERKADSNHFCFTHFGKITPYEQRDKIYSSITLKEIKTFALEYLNAKNVSYAMYGPIR